MPIGRENKVLRLRILKPVNMDWREFARLLREVRYRTYRLANLAMSESYLAFHQWRSGKAAEYKKASVGLLNGRLLEMLKEEHAKRLKAEKLPPETPFLELGKKGALPTSITDALTSYKLAALTAKAKWAEVIRGKSSLPTFRGDMAVPVRCEKSNSHDYSRLERTGDGGVEVDLQIRVQPYPRVRLSINERDQGGMEVLNRLLDNPDQLETGHRQRSFEIIQDRLDTKIWWLNVSYDFPKVENTELDPNRIVGVDVGFSSPLFAALSDGWERLGNQEFGALGSEIRKLRLRTMANRRAIQRGGRRGVEDPEHKPARTGHGVSRKLLATERLQGKINDAQKTLNHRMSSAVVEFAKKHKAGVIQMEDLSGLGAALRGTFLQQHWRYFELQSFIDYKAKAAGIEFRKVNPRYSSRRCGECGSIDFEFSRAFRDKVKRESGKDARFVCKNTACKAHEKPVHADYNAAKNLAVADLEKVIRAQCKVQGRDYDAAESSLTTEAEEN